MRKLSFLSGISGLVLAGCSGSSVNLSQPYPDLLAEADRLADRLETLGPTAALPPGGEATYRGVIVMADDFATSTTGVIGSANLTADFVSDTISGSAGGFYQSELIGNQPTGGGTPTAGSLTFASTGISTLFFLDVDGSVTIDGTSRPVSGEMLGGFFGPNAEMVSAFGEDIPAGAGFDVDAALIAD